LVKLETAFFDQAQTVIVQYLVTSVLNSMAFLTDHKLPQQSKCCTCKLATHLKKGFQMILSLNGVHKETVLKKRTSSFKLKRFKNWWKLPKTSRAIATVSTSV